MAAPRLHWTRQGPYLLAAVGLLAALGLAFRSWMPVALALPTLIYLCLGVARAPFAKPPRPTFTHQLPEADVLFQQPFRIGLVGRVRAGEEGIYEVHDRLPEAVQLARGRNVLLAPLGPQDTEFSYTVRSHARGRLPLGPVRYRRWDPWHFFAVEGSAPTDDSIVVEVEQEPYRHLRIPYRRHRRHYGPVPVAARSIGTEFFAIREYQPLDDRRRINWRATARWEGLYSNEYEPERSFDVALMVDLRPEATLGTTGNDTTAAIRGAAVALLEKALADHSRVALFVLGEGVRYVPLGSGRRRRGELVDDILSPSRGEFDLASIPVLVQKTLPRTTLILILSTLVDDDLGRTLVQVAKYGHDMLVVTPDPLGYVDRAWWSLERLTMGLQLLRRKVRVEQLRRFAPVLEWQRGVPLATLMRLPRRGRG